MLDKKLVQDWREYQENQRKRKMAAVNVFNCIFRGMISVTLTVNEENGTITMRPVGRQKLFITIINRIEMQGFSPDERDFTIQITFKEEVEQDPIQFQFESYFTFNAATEALMNFLRERMNAPATPPSSDGSD